MFKQIWTQRFREYQVGGRGFLEASGIPGPWFCFGVWKHASGWGPIFPMKNSSFFGGVPSYMCKISKKKSDLEPFKRLVWRNANWWPPPVSHWVFPWRRWEAQVAKIESSSFFFPNSRQLLKKLQIHAVLWKTIDIVSGWWQLKYFFFTPILGEMIQLDEYFFKWVETTN